MLNAYVKRPLTLERYRSRPAGPHLDAFIHAVLGMSTILPATLCC